MLRITLLVASLLAVAAFSPASRASYRGNALKMVKIEEVGVLPPTSFFDPLGLSEGLTEADLYQRKEAELKHGRVAMLAVVGYLVQESVRLPGTIDFKLAFADIPNGIDAIGAIPSLGWLQIVASIGYWELVAWEDRRPEGGAPGDFDFGSKLLKGKNLEGDELIEYKTKEVQNGRLAMLAIMELITHDIAKPAGESLFAIHHF